MDGGGASFWEGKGGWFRRNRCCMFWPVLMPGSKSVVASIYFMSAKHHVEPGYE